MIVGLAPVKVGHRQAKYTKTPGSSDYQGFFMSLIKVLWSAWHDGVSL